MKRITISGNVSTEITDDNALIIGTILMSCDYACVETIRMTTFKGGSIETYMNVCYVSPDNIHVIMISDVPDPQPTFVAEPSPDAPTPSNGIDFERLMQEAQARKNPAPYPHIHQDHCSVKLPNGLCDNSRCQRCYPDGYLFPHER